MAKISELLRWKHSVVLHDQNNQPILDENGKEVVVHLRIIGDKELETALKVARIKTSELRKKLLDPESVEFAQEVGPLREAEREQLVGVIRAAKANDFTSEAYSNVVRPDLPLLEEIAVDPDAPTLEEQEKLDSLISKVSKDYDAAVQEYVEVKLNALGVELDSQTFEEILTEAQKQIVNITVLSEFYKHINIEKIWRACYLDPKFTVRAFSSAEEFEETPEVIKEQLISIYITLEQNPDLLKN